MCMRTGENIVKLCVTERPDGEDTLVMGLMSCVRYVHRIRVFAIGECWNKGVVGSGGQ